MSQLPTTAIQARYVHTNLIARDWQALARPYEMIFGCVRVPPERDLAGSDMAAGTGIPAAHLRGAHMRLPGYVQMGLGSSAGGEETADESDNFAETIDG
ncbi:MAG: hypothetical protein CVU38_02875 [Chloroflexi bacterium HGW-Chloroflexi-1]|nr:MAG: hypothetical protein CVU38_02875 [Chloroflexi bacterium HGW-Chloroflexi-1]